MVPDPRGEGCRRGKTKSRPDWLETERAETVSHQGRSAGYQGLADRHHNGRSVSVLGLLAPLFIA